MQNEAETRQYARLHTDVRSIFKHALSTASIAGVFAQALAWEGSVLRIQPSAAAAPVVVDLGAYRHVLIIALGKAAVPMVTALCQYLPAHLRVGGVCASPEIPSNRPDPRLVYYAGGHPFPNRSSFRAARAALRLLRCANQRDPRDQTFVFFLISGGGSSLFELPANPEISLEDTVAFHRALVGCGAPIAEINVVRKHFSAVKGGRLGAAAPAGHFVTLQVADVPLMHLDALASGPTIPHRASIEDCREILARYDLLARFPEPVQRLFSEERCGDSGLQQVQHASRETASADRSASPVLTLLSNEDLLRAAGEEAQGLGYHVVVDTVCDEWEASAAARYLLERLFALEQQYERVCLISGGEVTVRLGQHSGRGGRNQQFALWCALELQRHAAEAPSGRLPGPRHVVLSAGSDGVDGSSPAAGALADDTTAARAVALRLEPEAALSAFDAYPLFAALGDLVVTGPTGNNLRDLRILISEH